LRIGLTFVLLIHFIVPIVWELLELVLVMSTDGRVFVASKHITLEQHHWNGRVL